MLKGNELIVIAKMISGEQVMACLNAEDEDHVLFEYPILIRMIPSPYPNRETIAATPYCQFSDDTTYVIDKRNIMFIKRLHETFVPHFMRFVKEYEDMAGRVATKDSTPTPEELFEEEEPLTVDEIHRRMEMLEAIAGREEREEIDWDEKLKNLVSGNDTKH